MRLKVPATTTNFGAGFDTFGLALSLYNVFEFQESDAFGVELRGYTRNIPTDESNLLIRVYKRACEIHGRRAVPFRLLQENRVPPARGLGSSATAIVGGIEAFCRIHSLPLGIREKLRIAYEFESHPDNLLPAFVGGFVVCATDEDTFYNRVEFPEDLELVFAVPDFELSTQKARKVLKDNVSLRDAVFNIQRASLFLSALTTKSYQLLKTAVQDRLHQPYRAKLVPGLEEAIEEGYSAGAYAVFLSGAGPSVCALVQEGKGTETGRAMIEAMREKGINAQLLRLKGSPHGARWDKIRRP